MVRQRRSKKSIVTQRRRQMRKDVKAQIRDIKAKIASKKEPS